MGNPKTEAEWQATLVSFIKAEMLRRQVTYSELSVRLAACGHDLDRTTLSNKINRGTFCAAFLCQVLGALGCWEEQLQAISRCGQASPEA